MPFNPLPTTNPISPDDWDKAIANRKAVCLCCNESLTQRKKLGWTTRKEFLEEYEIHVAKLRKEREVTDA